MLLFWKISKIIIINLMLLLMIFLLFETYLKYEDSYLEYPTYLFSTDKYNYQFVTEDQLQEDKRIYFFGDSFTMGYKCQHNGQDFPSLVQAGLQNSNQAINFGSGGLNTAHYLDIINNYSFSKNDSVIIVLYFNDIYITDHICPVIKSNSLKYKNIFIPKQCYNSDAVKENNLLDKTKENKIVNLKKINDSLKKFRTYLVVKQTLYNYGIFREYFFREEIQSLWENFESDENKWIISSLKSIKKELNQREINVKFTLYPNIANITESNKEYDTWNKFVDHLKYSENIEIYNPINFFLSNKKNSNMSWSMSDAHPNCEANKIMANFYISNIH